MTQHTAESILALAMQSKEAAMQQVGASDEAELLNWLKENGIKCPKCALD